jgi:5-formyltetrahydrofolate cyclo-ligase
MLVENVGPISMTDDGKIKREKQQLRRKIKHSLCAMPHEERKLRSQMIRAQIAPWLGETSIIAVFAGTSQEPDLDPFWAEDCFRGRQVLYPKLVDEKIQFCPVTSLTDLQIGRFGIREPLSEPIFAEPELILVPGLAFTPSGRRLGRGAGFYDRLLATLRKETQKLGICFRFQVLESLPLEAHDLKVDAVICG